MNIKVDMFTVLIKHVPKFYCAGNNMEPGPVPYGYVLFKWILATVMCLYSSLC